MSFTIIESCYHTWALSVIHIMNKFLYDDIRPDCRTTHINHMTHIVSIRYTRLFVSSRPNSPLRVQTRAWCWQLECISLRNYMNVIPIIEDCYYTWALSVIYIMNKFLYDDIRPDYRTTHINHMTHFVSIRYTRLFVSSRPNSPCGFRQGLGADS